MNKSNVLAKVIVSLSLCALTACTPQEKIITPQNGILTIEATNWSWNAKKFLVKAGEPVKLQFKNKEGFHALAINEFDIDIQGDGEVTFTPENPGEYHIYCNIECGKDHGDMKAKLIVE